MCIRLIITDVSPLAYRYLQLLIIAGVFLVSILNRDFGPMLTAERKASIHIQQKRSAATWSRRASERSEEEEEVVVGGDVMTDQATQTEKYAQGWIHCTMLVGKLSYP